MCLVHRTKLGTKEASSHVASGPGSCSSSSHYSALPLSTDGGAGMEHSHAQVTGALTKARCTEGTGKYMDKHLF